MPLYTETSNQIDITASTPVLTYTLETDLPKALICRAIVGSTENPVAGGGTYTVKVFINDNVVAPNSAVLVEAGLSKFVFQSREIPLEPNDVIRVEVVGLGGDVAVDVVVSLSDHTPVTLAQIYGAGSVLVDHDYGGTDNLTYETATGSGIDNATIHAFLKSDWDAGRRSVSYKKGATTTNARGRWITPMMLDPDRYMLYYFRQGSFANTRVLDVE